MLEYENMFCTRKIVISILLLFVILFVSCKVTPDNVIPEVQKKQNKLEKTQWKSTATSALDSDILLDFYTSKNVQEYITLPNGKDAKSKEGTYKISKSGNIKIKWGKLPRDQVDGHVHGKELILYERLDKRTYHKVKDY